MTAESVITRLKAVAARQPEAIAILDRGTPLSYGALWDRILAAGADMARRGLGAEDIIGVDLAKSSDYITAILGVWAAGAAFLPLDPALPEQRRAFLREEAQPKFIIDAHYAPAPAPDFIPAVPSPAALAYLIYTSGSTGRPKGVLVEHRGLLPVLDAQIPAFGLGPGKTALFYLSISFDAALSDIGTALLSGATLVIEDDAALRDGAALLNILDVRRITHFDCPPSLLRAFQPEDMPRTLETLVIGGEPAAPETVRHWARHFNVVNVYGPTEATICSSLCRCDAAGWTQPLIGTPVPGTRYHVFDNELFIEGDSLARGYFSRHELNAEKFVMRDGLRLYRTGDKVEPRADGEIIFRGRIDRQFKLRGQLIEPREIESVLEAVSGVARAAVLKRDNRLVAFVAAAGADDEALKAAIAEKLPRYMVPDRIEFLRALPLTPSGKPDLSALQALPLNGNDNGNAARDMPATPTEKALYAAWARVLGHARFGVTESFSAAGGDSLAVLRLTLEAERDGLSFSPGMLVLYPSIRALAAALDAKSPAGNSMTARQLRGHALPGPRLDTIIRAARDLPRAGGPARAVFVTGATGSLGGRLVAELLAGTAADIYCLVRAPDGAGAAARLARALGFRDSRVIAVAGDIARENFGLGHAAWQDLAQKIDAVYHCAAAVNMLQDFTALAPANLGGTREALAFALTGKVKPLHYASTLSVFVATDRNAGVAYENDALERTRTVYGGYAQTKWAAEFMLRQVPPEILPLHIYRFGLITGDSRTGAAAERDFLALFIEGIAALGVIPDTAKRSALAIDITPIDFAARAMADISTGRAPGTWHIANAVSLKLPDLLDAIGAFREVPLEEWRRLPVARGLNAAESSAWLSLCRLLPPADFERLRTMDLFQATDMRFDMAQSGFACPSPEKELVAAYARHVFARQSPAFRVCILGPESTGKSTLAGKLGKHFAAPVAPEFAKEYIERRGKSLTLPDIEAIAAGQARTEDSAAMRAENLLICDSNLLTTCLWSRFLFGACPPWLLREARLRKYDLYLLAEADVPWIDDAHRLAPAGAGAFMDLCREALRDSAVPVVRISGSWQARFDAAVDAIENHLKRRSAA